MLRKVKLHKAPGPDGLKGKVLKESAVQLGHVCTRLFQIFLDSGFVPLAWKNSTVIPVPKIPFAKPLNYFRPTFHIGSLQSIVCNCNFKLGDLLIYRSTGLIGALWIPLSLF